MEEFTFQPSHFVILAIVVSMVLIRVNQRYASPVLAIFNRWLRWGIFATGTAILFQLFGWSDRSFGVLSLVFGLVWLLGETIYNWLAIHALSVSPMPLFPRFSVNTAGDEWPTNPRLLKVRDWLRAAGFKQVQALKAEMVPGIFLRLSVYQDAEAKTRVTVTFLPQPGGTVSVCYSLSSNAASGRRYVTDNLYLPFGGFYPEAWSVERNLWRRSLPRLVARHRDRLAQAGETVCPWTCEPLVELNAQQYEMDRVNTELGFLMPPPEREEHGKISHAGRYRVWMECWLLNYLGRSVRYE